jgi:hypothetical protein
MSREGAPNQRETPSPAAGTPILVWLVYGAGILGAALFVFSFLFTAGAYFFGGSGYSVSPFAFVFWGAIVLAAVVTWYLRRRQRQ